MPLAKTPARLALIAGAGQGIGRACALALAQRGADLILFDLSRQTLSETAAEAASLGRRAASRVVDVTDQNGLEAALASASSEIASGPINVLINSAGLDRPGATAKIDRADFEAVLSVHLGSTLSLIKLVLPGMRRAGWGRIVNIGSIYGLIGAKGEVAYCTAKAGLIGLTKSVAQEAAADGVTVNAVLPGLTRTPTIETVMADRYKEAVIAATPLGRMAEAREVAEVVEFLASERASYITGAAIPVSGGWGM